LLRRVVNNQFSGRRAEDELTHDIRFWQIGMIIGQIHCHPEIFRYDTR